MTDHSWLDRRAEILNPPPLLPGPRIRGRIRAVPEDFQVEEIPAYEPDGGAVHLFLTLEKRGWNTESALLEISRQLGLPRSEIGVAGQKDRHALTRQWISVPVGAGPGLATFSHPDIRLGPPQPHSHKLRRGHLKANRFRITVRGLDLPLEEAVAQSRRIALELENAGGMGHLYGEQRFGWDGRNVEIGLRLLARPFRIRPGDFALSALQSAMFNHHWLLRRERDLLRTVVAGDILQKTDTCGLFYSTEPGLDQQRLDAGELRLTGPIFGADRLAPPPGSPAADLEEETLSAFGTPRALWISLGKKAPGTRRALQCKPAGLSIQGVVDADGGAGLVLDFSLETGAFATRLLAEFCVLDAVEDADMARDAS